MFLAFLPVTQVGSWLYAVVQIKVDDKVQWIADFHVEKLKGNKLLLFKDVLLRENILENN